MGTPCGHSLWAHPVDTACGHCLWAHPVGTPYDCRFSGSHSYGFRIDAIRTPWAHTTAFDSDLFCTRTESGLLDKLRSFLPSSSECDAGVTPAGIAAEIVERLNSLRDALPRSALFPRFEFIGTSIYFLTDQGPRHTPQRAPRQKPPNLVTCALHAAYTRLARLPSFACPHVTRLTHSLLATAIFCTTLCTRSPLARDAHAIFLHTLAHYRMRMPVPPMHIHPSGD